MHSDESINDFLDSNSDNHLLFPFVTVDLFALNKNKISSAFGTASFISILKFNEMMRFIQGNSIDFKTASCEIPGHKHKTLTRYLRCYSSIVKIISLSTNYLYSISSITLQAISNRKYFYIRSTTDLYIHHYAEILLVTIFPIKIQLPLSDLEAIFTHIYRITFKDIFGYNIKEFISKIRIQNITISYSMTIPMVSIISYFSLSYRPWGDLRIREKISDIEKNILNFDPINYLKIVNINFSDLIIKQSNYICNNGCNNNILSNTGSKDYKGCINALKIADLNIPKFVQKITVNHLRLNSVSQTAWRYLRDGVNYEICSVFYK